MQRLGLDKNNKARKYHGVNDETCCATTHAPANHLDRTWSASSSNSSTEKRTFKNTAQTTWMGVPGIRSRSSPVLASTKKTLQVARNKTQKLCRDIFSIRNDLVYSEDVSSSSSSVPVHGPVSKLKNELIFAEESMVGMRRTFASYRRLQSSDYPESRDTKLVSDEKKI